jgi:hypothetical protein
MWLRELAERPHITIRLVPFSVGVYSHFRMPYVHLEFADPEQEDIVFLELPFDQLVIRENTPELHNGNDKTPSAYLAIFWEIETLASRDNLQPLLQHALDQL